MLEGLRALFVGGVRTSGQLLVDGSLRVEAGASTSVDRRRVVGKLVLVGEIVVRLIDQALAEPGATKRQHVPVSYSW